MNGKQAVGISLMLLTAMTAH